MIKKINNLAYPIFLSYMIEVIFTLFDKMIIGRINTTAFNSVSFMSNLLYVIIGALGVLTVVFNIFINKIEEKEKYFNHFLYIILIIGLITESIFILFGKPLIHYIYNLNNKGLDYAYIYLVVAGPTVLLNLIIFICSSYFRSEKNTIINSKITFISLIINLVIDLILVFIFKLEVLGCALGTSIGLLIGVLLYFKNIKMKIRPKYSKEINSKTIKLYFPLLTTELIETTIFTLVISNIISKLSSNEIGVYNIIETINGIVMLVVYAYSSASLTLTLQKEKCYNIASIISFTILLFLSIIIIIFNYPISRIITNSTELVSCVSNFIIFGLLSILFNSFKITYKELLNGLDLEKYVLIITFLSSIITILLLYILGKDLNVIYLILTLKVVIESIIYLRKVSTIN